MRREALVVGGGLIAMLVGCGDPTIRVVVGTNDSDVADFSVRVLRDDDEKFFETFPATQDLPASLLLENADTADDRDVVIIVEGNTTHPNDNSPVVIRRSARLDFHTEDVVMPMPLCEACAGMMCEDGQTCDAGNCVSDKVSEEDLDADDEQEVKTDCSGGGGGAGGGGGGGATCTGVCGDAGCGECPGTNFSYYLITCRDGYCIDSYEVPREMYETFSTLAHAVESECNLEPEAADLSAACTSDCGRHPVVGVAHCAADAYCKWTGGRLCTADEWINACRTGMRQGTFDNDYFYGDTYEMGRCNDGTMQMSTVPAQQGDACQSGDLYNMSGNVKEWTAECDSSSGSCTVRGGGFQGGSPTQFDCGTIGGGDLPAQITDTEPDIGFRCCRADDF